VAFSVANEFVFALLPGRMPMEYQLCAGTDPLEVADQKINLPLLATYLVTLVVNGVVPFVIYSTKVKDHARNVYARYRVQTLTLYSFTASAVIVVTMSVSMLTILVPYRINQNRVVEAKFHVWAYLLTVFGYLVKHASLRKGLWRTTLGALHDR